MALFDEDFSDPTVPSGKTVAGASRQRSLMCRGSPSARAGVALADVDGTAWATCSTGAFRSSLAQPTRQIHGPHREQSNRRKHQQSRTRPRLNFSSS
jgi:hypothetical protein